MSREIKFRAWEKGMKEMILVEDISFELRQINTTSAWRYFEEVELMQYTGLKDATGVDIYEGDICEELYEEILGVVKFSEGKFIIVWDNSGDDLFEVSDEVRVVGNIYEHGYFVRGLEAE